MTFSNTSTRQMEAANAFAIRTGLILVLSLVVVSASILFSQIDTESRSFVLTLTWAVGLGSGGLGLLIGRKSFGRQFASYSVSVEPDSIKIETEGSVKTIQTSTIERITRLRDGSLVLHQNRFRKTVLSRYLDRLPRLEEKLSTVRPVEVQASVGRAIQFVPLILLVALQLSRLASHPWFYLLVGTAFVLTTAASIVRTIISGEISFASVVGDVLFGFLAFIVARHLWSLVASLFLK